MRQGDRVLGGGGGSDCAGRTWARPRTFRPPRDKSITRYEVLTPHTEDRQGYTDDLARRSDSRRASPPRRADGGSVRAGLPGQRGPRLHAPLTFRRSTRAFSTWFKQHRRLSGLPPIRVHDIRHAYVTARLTEGVPLKVVSQHVGHVSPMATMTIYQHVLPGDDHALRQSETGRSWATGGRRRGFGDLRRRGIPAHSLSAAQNSTRCK